MLQGLLKEIEALKGSDIYISVGLPVTARVNDRLLSLTEHNLDKAMVISLLREALGEARFNEFKKNKEANYAFKKDSSGRFRISAFMQKEMPAMVLRRIELNIPTFEELYLPQRLKNSCMLKNGLILFVGAAGAGKSTTQAAMIGYRNQNASGHILTIEDPIEFTHTHGKSIVTQREIGVDTESFEVALKNSLRQSSDVILIGEVRSRETMEFAITFAETGQLCMATLHANNANQALDRILHLVPEEKHRLFLFDLSVNLRAIVAQQLIPTANGESRRAAFEILYNTPAIAEAIRKGDFHTIKDIMKKSTEHGMQTFDQDLFNLYEEGVVGYKEALAHADSVNDLRLLIKLNSKIGRNSLGSNRFNDITFDC